ncbi:Hypothetical protein PHPALM_17547 [Phytophthora palmivora]|uniref:Uncharacterized protein n=1 Tax=Phytophthora palmivora TaxID=4796 RepID=A0A2P4XLY3_9STRA|nr:Hypothetical protein PHPALM_17547 [Phytophthora palmivora]
MRILRLKQVGDPREPVSAPIKTANKLEAVKDLLRLLKEAGMTTGAFDADDDESDLSSESKRMSLGPSGTSMLEARSKIQRRNQPRSGRSRMVPPSEDQITAATTSDASSGTLQKYFEAAMSRFLAEQRGPIMDQGAVKVQDPGSQDVDMESVRSEHSTSRWEYDPDFPTAARATVATATTGSAGSAGSTMIQREFTGKDQDEDRARAWIGKVKLKDLKEREINTRVTTTRPDPDLGRRIQA